MLKFVVNLLIVQNSISLSNIYKYVNSDFAFPKCCEEGFYLIFKNYTILCTKGGILNIQVSSKYNKISDNCVDLLLINSTYSLIKFDRRTQLYTKVTHFVKYPKCCPLGRIYDKRQHRCIYNFNSTVQQRDGLILGLGISQCRTSNRAVVDYSYIESNITIYTNLSIKFNGRIFDYGGYCFDTDVNASSILRVCDDYNNICKRGIEDYGIPCYKKCCPEGEIYENMQCVPTFDSGLSLDDLKIKWTNNTENFGIIHVEDQLKIKILSPYKFYLDGSGSLHMRQNSDWRSYNSRDAAYCIETVRTKSNTSQHFFIWSYESHFINRTLIRYVKAICLLTSALFIMLVFIINMLIPEMEIINGKPLVMYLIVTTIGSISNGFRLMIDPKGYYCVAFGFLLLFLFLKYFTWLNIICLDMWLTIGKIQTNTLAKKDLEERRFIRYNIYGWSFPSLWIALVYIIYKTKCLPYPLVPHIGTTTCFFDQLPETYDYLIYYPAPVSILVIINWIFFVKIVRYFFRVKNEIRQMKDTNDTYYKRKKIFNSDKQKLTILLKLGALMGIFWLLDIVSQLVDFKDDPVLELLSYIWHCCNLTQGVFIFWIFILRKKVLKSLKYKISQKMRRTS